MKKLCLTMLATLSIMASVQSVYAMQAPEDRWDEWLKEQNYYELKKELKELYKGSAAQQLQASSWTKAKLEVGLDPFLLYMNARSAFRGAGDAEKYKEGLTDFILCIALAKTARKLLEDLTIPLALDVASVLKEKFKVEYSNRALSGDVLRSIHFESIRDSVNQKLQVLHDSNELLKALPLPHWENKVTNKWWGATGFWWGQLDPSELAARSNERLMQTIVEFTKASLAVQIQELTQMKTWNEFFGLPEPEELMSDSSAGGAVNPGALAALLSMLSWGDSTNEEKA